jgi:hypothetical protein
LAPRNELKARGVKQGFKENIAVTDGPNEEREGETHQLLSTIGVAKTSQFSMFIRLTTRKL